MAYKIEVFESDIEEDSVTCVVGECPLCVKGLNSLVIMKSLVHPNVRERQKGNDRMFYLRCIACKYTTIKDKNELSENN